MTPTSTQALPAIVDFVLSRPGATHTFADVVATRRAFPKATNDQIVAAFERARHVLAERGRMFRRLAGEPD